MQTVVSFTCCGKYLSIRNSRPAAVVLLARRVCVRWVSKKASGYEQALGVFEGAFVPVVVLLGPLNLNWPADMDALCTVPTHLTLQLIWFHSLYVLPQFQFRA